MRAKTRKRDEQGVRHVTPAVCSVFQDLFSAEEAAELKIRSTLLMGLGKWLANARMTQAEAATVLNVTQARVSDAAASVGTERMLLAAMT